MVIDNGIGFIAAQNAVAPESDHIGLKNVTSRIENMSHGTLEIRSEVGVGTTVTVFIPEKQTKT